MVMNKFEELAVLEYRLNVVDKNLKSVSKKLDKMLERVRNEGK